MRRKSNTQAMGMYDEKNIHPTHVPETSDLTRCSMSPEPWNDRQNVEDAHEVDALDR